MQSRCILTARGLHFANSAELRPPNSAQVCFQAITDVAYAGNDGWFDLNRWWYVAPVMASGVCRFASLAWLGNSIQDIRDSLIQETDSHCQR